MAAGSLVLGTIFLGAVLWVSSGPGVAVWVYVAGGSLTVASVAVGLRIVLSQASTHQGKRVTIGDLTRMGALVGSGRPGSGSP